MKIIELKTECRKLGLKIGGTKPELINRIKTHNKNTKTISFDLKLKPKTKNPFHKPNISNNNQNHETLPNTINQTNTTHGTTPKPIKQQIQAINQTKLQQKPKLQ